MCGQRLGIVTEMLSAGNIVNSFYILTVCTQFLDKRFL